MSRAVLRASALVAFAACSAVAIGCSLLNQEGPTVTCEELQCGKINACEDGIIAQCVDGQNMRYHACELADACEQSWQIKGAYRCAVEDTDCEGCRPEREGCAATTTSSSASASSTEASSVDASSSASSSSGSSGASSGSGV